ncbi:MAG: flagellar hook-length control protein FliK [Planctomycetes bacterium]|nr:flagellar hook-length control protein FliK [Planctomycetota bacterium]
MQASTLRKSDAYPVSSPPLAPHAAAPASQAVLLPFLSELAQVDARNSAARRDEQREVEHEAETDGAVGLSGATSTIQEGIEKDERLMSGSSRAFRHRQALAEQREHAAGLRNTRQRAVAEPSEKSDTPVSTQRRSGANHTASRGESETTSNAPRPAMSHEQLDRPSAPRPSAAQRAGSAADALADTKAPPAAARVAAQSTAPDQIAARSSIKQPAEGALKPAGSARTASAESARPVAPASAADGRPSTARTGSESAEQQSSKREPAIAKSRASRASAADRQDPSKNDVNMKQLLRVIRSRISGPRSHMTMRLEPASLGSIRITMDLNDREMQLRIETESHLAQRMLSGKVDVLRDALESSGITLERFEVRSLAPPPDAQDAGQHEDVDQQSSGHGSTQANTERSPDQRESESPPSLAITDPAPEDETERTTESSLNVLA